LALELELEWSGVSERAARKGCDNNERAGVENARLGLELKMELEWSERKDK
jgi:hypothetical protein